MYDFWSLTLFTYSHIGCTTKARHATHLTSRLALVVVLLVMAAIRAAVARSVLPVTVLLAAVRLVALMTSRASFKLLPVTVTAAMPTLQIIKMIAWVIK